jgi:CheY-like chemotaxis protein
MARILIIEDDTPHMELVTDILTFGNHEIFQAKNTEIASAILAGNEIDYILTDIYLPGKSGLDFMEELKQQNRNIPFAVISGLERPEDVQKAGQLGALAYINKPLDNPETLLKLFPEKDNKGSAG